MNVLIFAYAFPPANLPAASRTWNMARTLVESGCTVSVVTIRPNAWLRADGITDARIGDLSRIEVPARWAFLCPWELNAPPWARMRPLGGVLRRVARWCGLHAHRGWAFEAAGATRHLRSDAFDVVLATGAPFASFALGRDLARRLGKPLILDYRDLWSQNPLGVHDRTAVRDEATIVRDAAAVMTVSPSLLAVLDRQHDLGRRGYVVTNGFDLREMASIQPVHFGHRAVVYAGLLYPPKQVATPLFAALKQVTGLDWRFHYAGPSTGAIQKDAEEAGLADRVVCHGVVSRRESLSLLAGADVAVVITTVAQTANDAERGIVTSKIFDALGLQRPIVAIAPKGSDVETILSGRDSTACVAAHETARMAQFIRDAISRRRLPPPANEFAWQHRGPQLRAILEDAVRRGSPPVA